MVLLIAVFVLVLLLQPTSSLSQLLLGRFIHLELEEVATLNTTETVSRLLKVDDELVSVHPGSYFEIDPQKVEDSQNHTAPITQAMVDGAGKYRLFYQQNGQSLKLCNNGTETASIDTEFPILTASVNGRGNVTVVTEDSGHKSRVTVYQKEGEPIFRWHSGAQLVTDAAMNRSIKRLAVCTLAVDHTTPRAYLKVFDTAVTAPLVELDLGERIPVSIAFTDDNLVVVWFSDGVALFNQQGGKVSDVTLSGALKGWDMTDKKFTRLLVSDGGTDSLLLYNGNTEIGRYDSGSELRLVSACKNLTAVSEMNRILLLNRKGEVLATYEAGHDIQHLALLSDKLLVYGIGNELKFLKIK